MRVNYIGFKVLRGLLDAHGAVIRLIGVVSLAVLLPGLGPAPPHKPHTVHAIGKAKQREAARVAVTIKDQINLIQP